MDASFGILIYDILSVYKALKETNKQTVTEQ